ncbi:unnamed protein product [Caenorhabditis nigoni]
MIIHMYREDRDPIFMEFLKRASIADLNHAVLNFMNERITHRGSLQESLETLKLYERIQCIQKVDAPLIYEAIPKSQSFAIAAGVRIITTASMRDKEGETGPNGTIGTVISFSKLCGKIQYVNIQFDGSTQTQRFGRKNPDGTNVFTFNFQPAYALTYHRAQGRAMDGVVLDIQGMVPSIQESAEYERPLF